VLSVVRILAVFGSDHGTGIAKYITFRRGEIYREAVLGPREGGAGPDRRSRLFLLGWQVSDLTCPVFQQNWSISDGVTEDQNKVLTGVSCCISRVYKRFS
jgi:hypothetical protein